MLLVLTLLLAGAARALVTAQASGTGYNWLQFNGDPQHSGNNTLEGSINTANVHALHLLSGTLLPSVADGAPAYLSHVAGAGGRDLLFVTTVQGQIVALDAHTLNQIWSKQPATGPQYTTSSPAVDPGGAYVYSYGLDGKVHKYQVGDGTESTVGGWPELATLKPDVEKGSSALAIATDTTGTTYLYVANGGYPGDAGDYQGHITAINLATGAQRVFNMNCSDQTVHFVENGTPDCGEVQTAVWARPGVVYYNPGGGQDRILLSTGNGTYDANANGHDWGDSVLALHPDGSGAGNGQPLDSYTPTEFLSLQRNDADIGSTTVAIVTAPAGSLSPSGKPIAHLGVQGGKDANLRLLNLDNLSDMGGPDHIGGEIYKGAVPQGGEVLTQPAVWASGGTNWVFVSNGNGISGLTVQQNPATKVPFLRTEWSKGTGGASPLIANGVLYYAGGGKVYARDPTTGAVLWSAGIGGTHWESPIVANGVLYITDESKGLSAFTLGGAPQPSPVPAGNCTAGARVLGPDPSTVLKLSLVVRGGSVASSSITYSAHGARFAVQNPTVVDCGPVQGKLTLSGSAALASGPPVQNGDTVRLSLGGVGGRPTAELLVLRNGTLILDSVQGPSPATLAGSYAWIRTP